jgi:hypothetical protein
VRGANLLAADHGVTQCDTPSTTSAAKNGSESDNTPTTA